jgi:hypothetical protein
MDTSKTYIKMCEKATEIQRQNMPWAEETSILRLAHQLDTHSYYAVKDKELGDFYCCFGFAEVCVFNATVKGYINAMILPDYFGCAVRGDLPVLYQPDEVIWLPRQDQLQAMVDFVCTKGAMESLVVFRLKPGLFEGFSFSSMEIFWLAFVMREKYGKAWDGKNWQVCQK